MNRVFGTIGAPIVSAFFFISGYGLMSSYLEKKEAYLRTFLRARMASLLVPFTLSIIAYQTCLYIDAGAPEISPVLVDLIHGHTRRILPYSWYVFEIAFLYLIFYVAFARKERAMAEKVVITSLLSILLVYFLRMAHFGDWWYVSLLAFPLGLACKYIEMKSGGVSALGVKTMSFVLVGFALLIRLFGAYHFSTMLLYPLFMYVLFAHIDTPTNRALHFLGGISYEVYLIQGISVSFLRGNRLFIEDDRLYVVAALSSIVLFAFLIHKAGVAVSGCINVRNPQHKVVS